MGKVKSRRPAFNPPAKAGGFRSSVRVARRLAQPANRRTKTVHSASSLISTVPDDTTRQVRPRLSGSRRSPLIRSRADHRTFRVPTPWQAVFSAIPDLPKRAITCAKRSIRREVLHALKLTGKGSGAPHRRITDDSKEKC